MYQKIEAALSESEAFINLARQLGTQPEIIAGMEKVHDATAAVWLEIATSIELIESALPKRVDGSPAHRPVAS